MHKTIKVLAKNISQNHEIFMKIGTNIANSSFLMSI